MPQNSYLGGTLYKKFIIIYNAPCLHAVPVMMLGLAYYYLECNFFFLNCNTNS